LYASRSDVLLTIAGHNRLVNNLSGKVVGRTT
jgi:hypothetical protein